MTRQLALSGLCGIGQCCTGSVHYADRRGKAVTAAKESHETSRPLEKVRRKRKLIAMNGVTQFGRSLQIPMYLSRLPLSERFGLIWEVFSTELSEKRV